MKKWISRWPAHIYIFLVFWNRTHSTALPLHQWSPFSLILKFWTPLRTSKGRSITSSPIHWKRSSTPHSPPLNHLSYMEVIIGHSILNIMYVSLLGVLNRHVNFSFFLLQNYQDYVVQKLGGLIYRMHCFQTSASPIRGLTADILVRLLCFMLV